VWWAICLGVFACVCVYVCVRACVCVCVCVCARAHAHACEYACLRSCKYVHSVAKNYKTRVITHEAHTQHGLHCPEACRKCTLEEQQSCPTPLARQAKPMPAQRRPPQTPSVSHPALRRVGARGVGWTGVKLTRAPARTAAFRSTQPSSQPPVHSPNPFPQGRARGQPPTQRLPRPPCHTRRASQP
jgi:hypothetical protein